ncbi:MAG: DNA polymerase I [Firmicutes bacterium]|nr:DNA polymerase I [Bacillota bacterium]
MVLDGNSLVHRAFHAINPLTTSQGVSTNAVYGFTNMLLKLIAEEQPDYLAVAFDKARVTFRHEKYGEYKARRAATPEDLRPQFPLVKRVLAAMRIPVFEADGYEADDLIGTLAKRAEEEGLKTTVVTGDRDTLQLVSPTVQVKLTKRGISEMEDYDPEKLAARYGGLKPEQMIELKALVGDASDNIPGVPSVGEKTGIKLIQEFHTVDELLRRVDEVKPERMRGLILEHQERLKMNKWLVTLVLDVPVSANWEEIRLTEPDYPRLIEVFRELEFRSLIQKMAERMNQAAPEGTPTQTEIAGEEQRAGRLLARKEELQEFLAPVAESAEELSVFITANPKELYQPGLGIGFCRKDGETAALYLTPGMEVDPWLKNVLEGGKPAKVIYDAKAALLQLRGWGVELDGVAGDVLLEAYLDNPGYPKMGLDDLSHQLLNRLIVPTEDRTWALCRRAEAVSELHRFLVPRLKEGGLEELYYRVELPLVRVLAEMEHRGVALDAEQLEQISHELGEKIEELVMRIHFMAGEEFNINSTKQLGHILFEKLKLPAVKKTKTGFSTDAEVLEELGWQHEIVAEILEYRQLVKLKSTYVDGMRSLVSPADGRLHTTFNQAVTATGRLSSTEPNLQNIPIRLEAGRRLRKFFVPSQPGWLIVSADYSQIDLRALAHISGDEELVRAFHEGRDIHTHTASEVYGVPEAGVTSEMRRAAKAVNFGIVYGISDYGLSRNLGISRAEAKRFIDRYLMTYPGVRRFMEDIVRQARDQGYVTTLLNRRRYLPELFSSNRTVRGFGERAALNTPIQGTASDIIKVAMLKVEEMIERQGFKARMLLQVHDELIFEAPPEELAGLAAGVREAMESAVELKVPLVADLKYGPNWYDMQPLPR